MADATELPPFRPLPQKAPDVEMRTAPGGIHYIAARHAPGVYFYVVRVGMHETTGTMLLMK